MRHREQSKVRCWARMLTAGAMAALALEGRGVWVEGDEQCTTVYLREKTVIIAPTNATLTVTEPGEIELLMVGGGGGGGGVASGQDANTQGGGGGGGGVIHKKDFAVMAGQYVLTVGRGGAKNMGNAATLVRGGDTTAFGLTAYGGGCGAMSLAFTAAGNGGSGGGNSKDWSGKNKGGGKATFAAQGNLGHDGALATGVYSGGGGGGAGAVADGTSGGCGYACSITGSEVWYAGGGGGAGTNGLGGGSAAYGGGGKRSQAGGNGVVIVSFVRPTRASEDFAIEGGHRRYFGEEGTALAFTNSATLTVTGEGTVDLLLVGGGGGGGENVADGSGNPCWGGGGGGGGVRHLLNVPVSAGTYAITVGAGGIKNHNLEAAAKGGNSTALGFTAYGGGYGAKGQGFTYPAKGGSGGGGSGSWNGANNRPGAAADHTLAPDCNLANAGSDASDPYKAGGGGGAGGAASGTMGGIGYLCDITGEALYYAGGGGVGGGGAGGGGATASGTGSPGMDGLGGGGGPNAAGGSGVVIVRFRQKGYRDLFDDATGGKTGTYLREGHRYRVHTFATDGTFTLPAPGKIDVLLVGGGGAGGANCPSIDWSYGGGGGAGGVVHKEGYVLDSGEWAIAIGAGGTVDNSASVARGRATTAFGFTAWGGGGGAEGGAYTAAGSGASGGGGSKGWNDKSMPGASPVAGYLTNYGNLGNKGADALGVYKSGGGGGAGAAASGGNGGLGYASDITGKTVFYAGGGNGNEGTTTAAQGSGNTAPGGGGRYGQSGGAGLVIVRHEIPRSMFFLTVQ